MAGDRKVDQQHRGPMFADNNGYPGQTSGAPARPQQRRYSCCRWGLMGAMAIAFSATPAIAKAEPPATPSLAEPAGPTRQEQTRPALPVLESQPPALEPTPTQTSIPTQTQTQTSPQTQTQAQQLIVRLKERRVELREGETVVATYPIAIGRRGWETPTGTFEIRNMVRNPIWQHPWNGSLIGPGAGNPLGDRWLGFWTDGNNVIGFHGTTNEELIGQAVSHGCIRMKNRDVRDLFDRVSVGTPVQVVP
jgi:lipoprotein-anchoring transpeptidase ErfK/SrfK